MKDCFVVFAFTTNSVLVVSFILVEVAVRLCYMIIYFSFVLVACWLLFPFISLLSPKARLRYLLRSGLHPVHIAIPLQPLPIWSHTQALLNWLAESS